MTIGAGNLQRSQGATHIKEENKEAPQLRWEICAMRVLIGSEEDDRLRERERGGVGS